MSAEAKSASDVVLSASKQQFLQALERESQTTLRVLRAYPEDQLDFKPHERSKTARQLAWLMAIEFGMSDRAMQGESPMGGRPPAPPEDFSQVIGTLESTAASLRKTVANMDDSSLVKTVPFPTGPGKMGEYPRIDFLWFILLDQIHHRGQFSVYLRQVGGKVPSIYGPSADEPWM